MNLLSHRFLFDETLVFANAGKGHQTRLISNLLQDYDRDARPVINVSDLITLTFRLSYIQLQELDEPTQVARSLVWVNMRWEDAYLKWNASEYGGNTEIRLSPTRIWKPDLTLYNNANKDGAAMYDLSYPAIVQSDGSVSLGCPLILESMCPIDISNFPFDTQICKLKLGSWAYNGFDLDIHLKKDVAGIDLGNLEANSVWKLESVRSKRNKVKYTCCPEPYIDLTYTFEFRRKPLYYIMTIIFPSVLLSLLSCVSFLFPAGSGERVSLVISVLLGLVVFMLIVNERTPVTSDATPMLTQFFNSIGGSTVLALMATAFILRLNHADGSTPVPSYLVCIRDCIAFVLCMRREPERRRVEINFEDILLAESQVFREQGLPRQLLNVREVVGITAYRKQMTDERILTELQKITRHFEEEEAVAKTKLEWDYTMKVFDRFFFVIFFLIFVTFASYVFSF
ncbi:neuronal acetylcholine receptor subunit alpha-7-like [Dendronephthya gigantea]|uniref:neuronal acetylcholine receptor subunit alpha-7-like n=1 Tax=Dendronephthya gigantea TaxID=151771 RepID=UPI00106CA8A3|nr:neuronal acetylcholine receptor subunit alpha-7-like [Dendronephthya gigantea]